MTRAALLLSDHFARLHLRLRPAPTSLLQSRQLTTSKHLPGAFSNAASNANKHLPGFFDSQPILRTRPSAHNSQIALSRLAQKDIQFLKTRNTTTQVYRSSASSWIALSLAGLLSGAVLYAISPTNILSYLHLIPSQHSMSVEIPPGRPETLTKEEEQKLRELWVATFKLCGLTITNPDGKADTDTSSVKTAPKRRGFFRRVTGGGDADADAGEEDKFGLKSVYNDALKSMSPQEIRESIWGMVKIDDPDHLMLRFLRARKWDVQRALVMMIATMKWRQKDMCVDEEIMKNGELVNLDESEVISPAKKKLANDIMAQLLMGKSFLHGLDKEGRPMCFIRVRLHKPGAQSAESLERFTVYQIETTRLMMQYPVDTAVRTVSPPD